MRRRGQWKRKTAYNNSLPKMPQERMCLYLKLWGAALRQAMKCYKPFNENHF